MKCSYCEFEYETRDQYKDHLNAVHTKCAYCDTVFPSDQFDDDYAVCLSCRLEDDPADWV